MPKRTDITKIFVLGSGPITIGQGCEFDYSGTQACTALRQLGYETILVNSNPATIMTDPGRADKTYIEPLTVQYVEQIILKEKPQALLSTMGGQTALNLAVALSESGFLESNGVELLGARLESIKVAEDRELFRSKMIEIGLKMPKSRIVRDVNDIPGLLEELSLPVVVRPSFTLGGTGGGIAHTMEQLIAICENGVRASQIHTVLVEESVIGWKEIELEVVRDRADNFIVICAIENFDPMGVHTGDSIAVAPLQTLSDREYQRLRDAARKIAIAVGLECGGANIQFAVCPRTGEFVVIEMNPRVSRSSALASKATGYPIAKVAAKLAVGMTLDEISNDIAGGISACFEPTVDYVVTKVPRFDFGKFAGANGQLGTEMKAVGEAMAVGATFQESVQKALRSLELGVSGFSQVRKRATSERSEWLRRISMPTQHRISDLWGAFASGITVKEATQVSGIDPWFLHNLYDLWELGEAFQSEMRNLLDASGSADKQSLFDKVDAAVLSGLKQRGFSDSYMAQIFSNAWQMPVGEDDVYALRSKVQLFPCYKSIDTCAAEFPTNARYHYSSYLQDESEHIPSHRRKVIIVGSGPNRIGQRIEFDYCCVQASLALRDLALQSVMINCNPETVSTDYDVSDVLYFEPVTLEDVSNIARLEQAEGIIIQLGGQTPLKLAQGLERRGFKILGTSVDSTDLAEDRERFSKLISELGLKQPQGVIARSVMEAVEFAGSVGYPVLIRPNYVLGGKSMQVVHEEPQLREVLTRMFEAVGIDAVLVDEFLANATEIDVDAVSDGRETVVAGVLEHVEPAGVHSGDSSCVFPPVHLPVYVQEEINRATIAIADALSVVGFLNVQFAVRGDEVFVLEANPRASRTIPFISKATGVPWARIATRLILGERLADLKNEWKREQMAHYAVKSPVIPFSRFAGACIQLGPEMRSTGEVMGIGPDFATAYARAQLAVGRDLTNCKNVVISGSRSQVYEMNACVGALSKLKVQLHFAHRFRSSRTVEEEARSVMDFIRDVSADLVVSLCKINEVDEFEQFVRRSALQQHVPLILGLEELKAFVESKEYLDKPDLSVTSLQEYTRTDGSAAALRAVPEAASIV